MTGLSMAYSPCPNDTFMFCDVAEGTLASSGYNVTVHLHDVETLNRLALAATYDLTKVSFRTYLLIREQYQLLNVGAALGFGCGPLLVAKRPIPISELPRCRVVIPGELTTAHLLLQLWAPGMHLKTFVPYDQIMAQVLNDKADCGVIIHESRFAYQAAGLTCLADLGQWWEQKTGHPIPLGCIVARKSLETRAIAQIEDLLRQGIQRSLANPEHTAAYVGRNAQETDASIHARHISMFVNEFSLNLGEVGHAAVAKLEEMARGAGFIR